MWLIGIVKYGLVSESDGPEGGVLGTQAYASLVRGMHAPVGISYACSVSCDRR